MSDMTKSEFRKLGYDTADFDALVEDAASKTASRVNNEGLTEQIGFLRNEGWSDSEILKALDGESED